MRNYARILAKYIKPAGAVLQCGISRDIVLYRYSRERSIIEGEKASPLTDIRHYKMPQPFIGLQLTFDPSGSFFRASARFVRFRSECQNSLQKTLSSLYDPSYIEAVSSKFPLRRGERRGNTQLNYGNSNLS